MRIEPLRWAWVGRIAYREAIWAMERVAERVISCSETGRVLFLEHPPTVTLGRRAGQNALKAPADRLSEMGISIERADRGGEATYHGPGQLVVYPVVNLRALGVGVEGYVEGLQEATRLTLADFGVSDAWGDMKRPGVWTPGGKIAAIGLRVRRGVATHGMALNIDVDRRPFDMIVPCGMEGVKVACMADYITAPTLREVSVALAGRLGEVFGAPVLEEDVAEMVPKSRQEVEIA